MSKRVNMSEKWVTYPHRPLEKLADNLWVVEGELPHMPIGRKMSVIKKSTGSLVLHSPLSLSQGFDAASLHETCTGQRTCDSAQEI